VGGVNDGGAGRGCIAQDGVKLVTGGRVESGVRLVEQPHRCSTHHERCKSRPAPLSGRQRSSASRCDTSIDSESCECIVDVALPRTDEPSRERNVLTRCEVGVQTVAVSK